MLPFGHPCPRIPLPAAPGISATPNGRLIQVASTGFVGRHSWIHNPPYGLLCNGWRVAAPPVVARRLALEPLVTFQAAFCSIKWVALHRIHRRFESTHERTQPRPICGYRAAAPVPSPLLRISFVQSRCFALGSLFQNNGGQKGPPPHVAGSLGRRARSSIDETTVSIFHDGEPD